MTRYTQSHEWFDEKTGQVGISHFAQKELGEIVYVQLPQVGAHLKAGAETAVLESTKAAADVYAPVSGKVIAINEAAVKDPSLINTAPETTGWLFRLQPSKPEEIQSLMTKEQYLKLVQ